MSAPFPGYYDVIVVDPNGPPIGRIALDASIEPGDVVFGYQPDDEADTGIGRLYRVVKLFWTSDYKIKYAQIGALGEHTYVA